MVEGVQQGPVLVGTFFTEKRIKGGGRLGSSAANLSHLPLLYRWEGQGDWCSCD